METFNNAITRIEKNLSILPNDVAKFKALAEKAHAITIDNLKKDEDYEDAPDEFIGKTTGKKNVGTYLRQSWLGLGCLAFRQPKGT